VTRGRRGRIIAFVALVTVCAPTLVRATPFADVRIDSWPYRAIQTLAAAGLIDGYPDGAFQGQRPLTRDEMATIVARVGAKIASDGAQTASRADLDALRQQTGVLAGELDALGVRVTALDRGTAFAPSLSDRDTLPVSSTAPRHPANSPIRMLRAAGLIEGYPDGAFRGARPVTRYEMAAIVARVVVKIAAQGAQTASRADLETMRTLTGVVADELAALGVRVAALEDRLAARRTRTAFAPSPAVPLTPPPIPTRSGFALDGDAAVAANRARPLTRDEAAVIVAGVVATIEAEGAQAASKADLDTLQKQTGVLAGELDALGVRVTALESHCRAATAC
jgi:hypothetical protein